MQNKSRVSANTLTKPTFSYESAGRLCCYHPHHRLHVVTI